MRRDCGKPRSLFSSPPHRTLGRHSPFAGFCPTAGRRGYVCRRLPFFRTRRGRGEFSVCCQKSTNRCFQKQSNAIWNKTICSQSHYSVLKSGASHRFDNIKIYFSFPPACLKHAEKGYPPACLLRPAAGKSGKARTVCRVLCGGEEKTTGPFYKSGALLSPPSSACCLQYADDVSVSV